MSVEPEELQGQNAGGGAGSATHDITDERVGVGPATVVSPFHRGSPAAVGVPTFIVGSVALGLALINYVPGTGAALPIILAATGLGQLITCLWAIGLGESVVASIFGIFGGFWFSYALLVFGLTHNWLGVLPANVVHTEALFLISWLVVIGLLTLASFRLPLVFSLLFILVEIALALVLVGTINASAGTVKAGGVVVFIFAALGGYIYFDTMSIALGGKGIGLGAPIHKG